MKIILFLAAVYALIINQCQQRITHTRIPGTNLIQADNRDSMAEASRAVRIEKKDPKEDKKTLTNPFPYSLASYTFLKD